MFQKQGGCVSIALCLSQYFLLLGRVLRSPGAPGAAWLVICPPTDSPEKLCTAPWGVQGQVSASWVRSFVRQQFSVFLDWSHLLSFVKAVSPISIHTHSCPIPLRSLQALGAPIQQWGAAETLGTSYFLSACVIETACLTAFFNLC